MTATDPDEPWPSQSKGSSGTSETAGAASLLCLSHRHRCLGFFFFCFSTYVSGLHHVMWYFCLCDRLKKKNLAIEEVTFRLCGWCVLDVFLFAGIHPSRTWMSGSFESVRWNACEHGLDLGFYSRPKEFWGTEWEPMLIPSKKNLLYRRLRGGSIPRRCITQDSESKHYRLSCSGPRWGLKAHINIVVITLV